MSQIGLYDESSALERLSKLGDKLEWLDEAINWNIFLPLLRKSKPDKTKNGKGGRPPLPLLMMFKILILQDLYNMSFDQMEFQINDRLTWKRFIGLTFSDKSPDATTIQEFREILTNTGVYDALFTLFNQTLEGMGVITHKGSIDDASFVDVPRQRNTRAENKIIKEGGTPEEWELPENAKKLSQKDMEAAWAKKNDELHYGYKDHVLVDRDSKIITEWRVTPANVHDSQMLMALITEKVEEFWADSAYMSAEILAFFQENFPKIKLHINEKGYSNKPMTEEQKASNREKSKIRSRVEHVFGHMTNSMGGMMIRCIGITRAESKIVMKNLAYNLSRYETLVRLGRAPKMA